MLIAYIFRLPFAAIGQAGPRLSGLAMYRNALV